MQSCDGILVIANAAANPRIQLPNSILANAKVFVENSDFDNPLRD